jgi:hypothetical protein
MKEGTSPSRLKLQTEVLRVELFALLLDHNWLLAQEHIAFVSALEHKYSWLSAGALTK